MESKRTKLENKLDYYCDTLSIDVILRWYSLKILELQQLQNILFVLEND